MKNNNDKNEFDALARRQFLRTSLKTGIAAGAFSALPTWTLPALAQGEELIPFTDMPENFSREPAQPGAIHFLDTRQIKSFYTRNEDFYVVQHYGQPELDLDTFSLEITGLVNKRQKYSLEQIKQLPAVEIDAGFECGGNRDRVFHGLIGNAKWKGARLVDVLKAAGIQEQAKEIVFFGGDIGKETIREKEIEQSFARSLSVKDAMNEDILLAYEMNGEALPLFHGKPLRLIVPGWYGVANVKWLTQIHVQDTRFMGRFMARDYVTLKKDDIGGQQRWVEQSVTKMNLKSIVARVTKQNSKYTISGFVLNDGTPLKSVEIKIDDGSWQTAKLHPQNSKYSWKLFSLEWNNPSPGEHTLVSRATDASGREQPQPSDLPEKVTYWEDFGQFIRKIKI